MSSSPPSERRLAAILAADVVGYSRLMGRDEQGTLDRMKEHRRALIDPEIANRRGRIVKTTGDGMLVEFPSVVDAVECALSVQRGMAERNTGTDEASCIRFRIAVNLGDIIVEDGDIFGDGVNIAARLQEIAQPGGICLSEDAFRQVRGKIALDARDIGTQRLKNIAEPVHAYGIAPPAQTETRQAMTAAPRAPDKASIAVLPFDNMSPDPDQEYFADGMTEDIITELSKITGLLVIARNSSFFYKRKQFTVRQVGQELGVRYVLEGSVRKAGNRVRINAQLIEAGTDHHLWADKIDGDLTDVFALQDSVTRQVVDALALRLAGNRGGSQRRSETTSVDAYDLLLRARAQFNTYTRQGNAEARRLTERALLLDPNYARAYVLLADLRAQEWNQFWSNDRAATLGDAAELAEKALALGGADGDAHCVLGNVMVWQFRHDEALLHTELAVKAEPGNTRNVGVRAVVLGWSGRHEEAIAAIEEAMRLDPNHGGWMPWAKGQALFSLDRYAEAAEVLRAGIKRQSSFMPLHLYLMMSLYKLGRLDEAVEAAKTYTEMRSPLEAERLRSVPYRNPADSARLESAFTGLMAHVRSDRPPPAAS